MQIHVILLPSRTPHSPSAPPPPSPFQSAPRVFLHLGQELRFVFIFASLVKSSITQPLWWNTSIRPRCHTDSQARGKWESKKLSSGKTTEVCFECGVFLKGPPSDEHLSGGCSRAAPHRTRLFSRAALK